MANNERLNKETREKLLEQYGNDKDILAIKEKYSKFTLNPLTVLKNKKQEKQEIDRLLINKEIARKEEEKRIRKEQQRIRREKLKESFKKHLPIYAISSAVIVIAVIVAMLVNNYKSTIREINFINTPPNQYVGDEIVIEYAVIPSTAKYMDEDIQVSYSDNSYLDNNILKKVGSIDAFITYDGKVFDTKTINVKPVLVSNIEQDDIKVGIGNSVSIDPIIIPKNATNKEYVLEDYDSNTISIEGNTITGLELGTSKLSIKTKDGFIKETKVNVIEIEPTKLEILKIKSIYIVGSTDTIEVRYIPEETTTRDVSFASSNNNVITVDKDGNIKAVGIGEANIIVTYNNDVKCEKKVSVIYPPCESITIDVDSRSLYVGSHENVHVAFNPKNNNDKGSLTFSSSDETILEVNENGKVTAISPGKATITAECGHCYDEVEISVIKKPVEPQVPATTNGGGSGSAHIEGDGSVVYITPYGEKYHKDPSCPASSNVYSTTTDKLPSRIKGPCDKCWR